MKGDLPAAGSEERIIWAKKVYHCNLALAAHRVPHARR